MTPHALRNTTVLVVEDNPDHRYITHTLLEEMGARVLTAENGAEAYATLLENRPDLALVDLMMPVVDGLEFARRVRRNPEFHQIRLVALTSLLDDRAYLATWSAGFDGHLEKPATIPKLEGLTRFLPAPRAQRRSRPSH